MVPFISVLIPTKNRAHLVGYAIKSVLDQSFEDFEIILVDNDDGDLTAEAVSSIADPRFRYFKTGGLNMSENWEFALDQAQGEYVTVLEDKQAYYPWALDRLRHTVSTHDAQVVIWEWDLYEDALGRVRRRHRSKKVEVISPEEVLTLYNSDPSHAWGSLPRMLNSCASRTLISEIRRHKSVRRFFDELSPDLCAAFYLLASVDELAFIRDGIGLVGYIHESTARKAVTQKNALAYYGANANLHDRAVSYLPVKSRRLVQNLVYSDYLRIREEVGGRLTPYKMEPMTYLRMCLTDAVNNMRRGIRDVDDFRLIASNCNQIGIGFSGKLSLLAHLLRELLVPVLKQFRRGKYHEWCADNIYDAVKKCPDQP